MKKFLISLVIVFTFLPLVFARLPSRLWQITALGNGSGVTTTVTPGANEHLVIKNIIVSLVGAGYIYFYTGDKNGYIKLSGNINSTNYFEPLNLKDVNWVTPKGEPLKCYASGNSTAYEVMVEWSPVST